MSLCRLTLQGSAKRYQLGLVNFTVAVAYHFCLSLPETFTQPGRRLFAEPCICNYQTPRVIWKRQVLYETTETDLIQPQLIVALHTVPSANPSQVLWFLPENRNGKRLIKNLWQLVTTDTRRPHIETRDTFSKPSAFIFKQIQCQGCCFYRVIRSFSSTPP